MQIEMAKECLHLLMVTSTLAVFRATKCRGMELINGIMGVNMRECGLMIRCMEKECLLLTMVSLQQFL